MDALISFICGMFIGGVLSLIMMSLAVAASNGDRREEDRLDEYK